MENETIWQCHNHECNAKYSEYVNGCPKCSTGEAGGSHKVSILNKFHPAYGDGLPKSPEMNLILRIVANWGNAIEMPKMEGWVKEYATGARWVKAIEWLPAPGSYNAKMDGKPFALAISNRYHMLPKEHWRGIEWLDERAVYDEKGFFDKLHSWLSSEGYSFDGEYYYDDDNNFYTPDQIWERYQRPLPAPPREGE